MKGNPVMKAKRVTGPTSNAEFTLRIRLETCSVQGCNNPPLRTSSNDGTITRICGYHLIHGTQRKQAHIVDTGWKPAWMC